MGDLDSRKVRETGYARSGDLSVAYEVSGDGDLDLVFVPGFVSHIELMWELPEAARFFARLASFARLIRYDKREQGLSDRVGRPPTLEEGTDDLRAVLDAVGAERPARFGVSEGGPMAQLFAATYPHRVRALVLYGTYARVVEGPDYPIGVPAAVLDDWAQAVVADWGGPTTVELFAPSMRDDRRFLEWWSRLLRIGTSPRGALALFQQYRQLDSRAALDAISAPTLVLQRDRDRLAPRRWSRYLAERIPGARYVELPGEDHVFFTEDQDAILDEAEEFLTGERREREPERVLATVLFGDIVDSTRRAAELGDRRWRDLMESHDALVRRQVERHQGRLVKTMGDGFLATFDGPARAIRCARAVEDGARSLGVELRAGLHTGECEVVGSDVGGIAVNIGARVGASAGPGEVLVSSTVKDLVVGSGIRFADHGEHELKGVPGSWRLYAVEAA
jgi:class 3 adenylate cyclase